MLPGQHQSDVDVVARGQGGAIVALGLAGGHASGAGQAGFVFYGREGSGPGLSLSRSGELIKTGLVEAVIMTVVITVSAARRQRRRSRRAKTPLLRVDEAVF